MTRRRALLIVVPLLVLGGVGVAIALDPAARVEGWIGGEPFFQGRSATAWRRDLRAPDGPRSAGALTALAEGKRDAAPVCAWVLRTAPEPEARWRAADALAKMGKDAAPAAGELVTALSDSDPLVRGVAVRAVAELAPEVADALPPLIAMFPDTEAIRAVSRFGPAGAPAVPLLTELLKHETMGVRWQAVGALGKIREPALPALPEIIRLTLSDPEPRVREHSAEAIGNIGPAAADGIPALVKALKDAAPRVRRDAVRSLGQMGAAAKSVLGDVKPLTTDPDPAVVEAATRAVRLIDPTVVEKK